MIPYEMIERELRETILYYVDSGKSIVSIAKLLNMEYNVVESIVFDEICSESMEI